MKVIKKEKITRVSFRELKNGDVFQWNETIFIKIPPFKDYCYQWVNAYPLTAFSEDYHCFTDDYEVILLDATLIIE